MQSFIRLSVGVITAIAVAGCGGKDGGEAGEGAGAEPAGLTKEALTGTWKGDFGELAFNADGTAKILLKSCSYEVLGPGRIKPPSDFGSCREKSFEGQLKVDGYKVSVGDPKKRWNNFQAYVDAGGKLHLGISPGASVAKLSQKAGEVAIKMFDRLVIAADGTCTHKDAMDPKAAPKPATCRFETADGKEILRYQLGDASEEGLVYLPKEDLLVPPSVEMMAFTKSP